MAKLSISALKEFRDLQNAISDAIQGCSTFEKASQMYTQAIYETFKESIVLVRHFATTPYQALPPLSRTFVNQIVKEKGVHNAIRNETLVMNLLGTSGIRPEWNHRTQSKGHLGIPLVSAAFIEAIPMMSRLLKELGMGLDWIDQHDADVVVKTMGSISGVFFVSDAATEIDHAGRKIIATQDFVELYDVKSVFGFGGAYLGTQTFAVTIIFLRETIGKNKAEQFAAGAANFKTQTLGLVKTRIFE